MTKRSLRPLFACTAAMAAVLATGCATKKHVQASIQPLEKRMEDLETHSKKTDSSISELERNLSKTDEAVKGADSRAGQAAIEAAKANERAARSSEQAEAAGRAAATAQSTAETESKRVMTVLDERITNLDNFELKSTDSVLFKFGSHQLTPEAKKQLDAAGAKIQAEHRYTVEIVGFTDKVGNAEYNLALSKRRADAVTQYLTIEQKLPLHRIFVNGAGSAVLVNEGKTREARELSRRVEVRLYTLKGN
ncbi:MAG: OmpA family protein [Acidobacteriia bacterium]|nr:OmpA family protein [Terriglobia bacterium]